MCGKAKPTMGGVIPWAGGSGLHSEAEQAMENKAVNGVPLQSLLRQLPEFMAWLPWMTGCKVGRRGRDVCRSSRRATRTYM